MRKNGGKDLKNKLSKSIYTTFGEHYGEEK
jgi:hypothetical protein